MAIYVSFLCCMCVVVLMLSYINGHRKKKERNIDCVSVLCQERERRRQHMMLMKAVEARKKAEVCNS